jgi:2-methylcitrate dehydratase PrpD
VNRKVTIEHFEGETYRDPQVLAVMAKVEAAPYTIEQFPAENHFGAEVKVTLRGGTVLGTKVDQPAGRTSANPLPQESSRACTARCSPKRASPASSTCSKANTADSAPPSRARPTAST